MSKGTLFLIPSSLDEDYSPDQLPVAEVARIEHLSIFAVENIKHARRYIRKLLPHVIIDDCRFFEIGKHAGDDELAEVIKLMVQGNDAGIISEAGLPGVADPGSRLVALAHREEIRVAPLIGPGSVFLALMGSGFNGQAFTFHGYLPREGAERIKKIKELEVLATKTGYTQLFMETPFRNEAIFSDLLTTCHPETLLSVARSLTTDKELVKTLPVNRWKKTPPKLHKLPTIFGIGKA